MEMEKLHNTIVKIQEKYKRDMNGRSGSSGVQNENDWDDVVSGSKTKNQLPAMEHDHNDRLEAAYRRLRERKDDLSNTL